MANFDLKNAMVYTGNTLTAIISTLQGQSASMRMAVT
jgi:hypothetical protein